MSEKEYVNEEETDVSYLLWNPVVTGSKILREQKLFDGLGSLR